MYPNDETLEFIEGFGLDTSLVESFKLIIEADKPIMVEVKMNITPEQLGYAIGVLRKFELTECQVTQ